MGLNASIHHTIWSAAKQLNGAGIENPKREAQLLFGLVCGNSSTTWLLAHSSDLVDEETDRRYQSLVDRRSQREPFAYISGYKEFYGLRYSLSSDVLIPRPDTELLVEQSIKTIQILSQNVKPLRFLDIGVGSGCVICSVAKNTGDDIQFTGTDYSDCALRIASSNAVALGLSGRIAFLKSDLFQGLQGQVFDLIVSNPPYIPTEQLITLEPEVRRYEPILALDGGKDGLDSVRAIVSDADRYLSQAGCLLLEIGIGQSRQVCEIAEQNGYRVEGVFDDLGAIPRVVKLSKQ